MITLNRRSLIPFRMAVRRCVHGRPRNFAPPILLQQLGEELILFTALEEVALALRVSSANATRCRLIVPWSIGDLIEKIPEEGSMELVGLDENRLRCRWSISDQTKETDLEVPPIEGFKLWDLPKTWELTDSSLLEAMFECGKVTAREKASRFALTRLQLRGDSGSTIGTDSKQLLLWSGFRFPFSDSILIPAIPWFGSRERKSESSIHLGRTEEHLLVRMGPWTVWLKIDIEGRFPDALKIIPSSSRGSRLTFDEIDVRNLLHSLTKGGPKEDHGVHIDLSSQPIVRFRFDDSDRFQEYELKHSPYSGPKSQVTLNRAHLIHVLGLGLHQMQIQPGKSPVVFRDAIRTYLTLSLDSSSNQPNSNRTPPLNALAPTASPTGEPLMIANRTDAPGMDPEVQEVIDPMTEAEALGEAFWELTRRTGRFLTSLSQYQKQHRILKSAWSNLKQFLPNRKEES